VLREGAGERGLNGLVELIDVARGRLADPFLRWQEAGLVRADLSVDVMVWELFAPLHIARFLHLRARDTDVPAARRVAAEHVAFFLNCVTTPERRSS
jgi:hypothetical protein